MTDFSSFDHRCMSLALRLASKGINTTHPNPRVGCVIAKDNQICAEGWHQIAGGPHAEIHALANVRGPHAEVYASVNGDDLGMEIHASSNAVNLEARDWLRGATAYITLEPCSHHGRTPPCTDALIKAGIKRVVCAMQDPNPKVAGNGIKQLLAAGIEVDCGLIEAAAKELNPGFVKRMRHGLPWVRVKMAQSLDGHIALANGTSKWISGPAARQDVQVWRARSDAILTGVGTVLADDPRLDVRIGENPRQPLRVIADSRWRTPPDARLLNDDGGAVLIVGVDTHPIPAGLTSSTAELCPVTANEGFVDLQALLKLLAARGINEIQVEAGAVLAGSLLSQKLIDELLIYQAPILLGGGAVSPFATPRLDNMAGRVHLKWLDTRRVGNDLRLRLRPES